MIELPSGWARTTLGTVADWGAGGTPSRSEPNFYGGNIPWIKSGELNSRYIKTAEESITEEALKFSSAKLFPAGSVAIAMYGATIGKTAILGIDASTNQACAVGVPVEGLIGKEYLYRLLQNEKAAFIEKGKGGAQPNISQAVIKAHEIGLPPLAEQTRIAVKLDELLTQVDTLKARIDGIPALLKRFRQSVLTAATSGRLTSEQCSSGYDEWIRGKLGDFVAIDIGHAFKSSDFSADGVRLLRGQNIEPGSLRWIETKFFPEEKLSSFEYLLISERDIILAMDRPIVSAGLKLARAKREDLPCLLVQRVCRFKQSQKILNDYLMLLLSDYAFSNYLIPNQTGSDIPHISGKQILNYPVTLPPLHEQTEIVRRVEKLLAFADQFEVRVKVAQARIDHLTQSILTRAFRGELVPQDPNDEPASVLLERIKTQRAAAPKARRGRQPGPVKPKVGRTSSCEPLELEAKDSAGC